MERRGLEWGSCVLWVVLAGWSGLDESSSRTDKTPSQPLTCQENITNTLTHTLNARKLI